MTIGKNWFMLDAHQVFGVLSQFLMLSLNKINLAKANVISSTWIISSVQFSCSAPVPTGREPRGGREAGTGRGHTAGKAPQGETRIKVQIPF